MSKSIQKLVDRGLELRAKMEELKEQLSVIETQLQAAALAGEQQDLEDDEREGRQWLAQGTEHIVPVVLTSDLLIKSFQDDSSQHLRIADRAGDKIKEFYVPKKTWTSVFDNGKTFRKAAAQILGDNAPEFITACLQRDKHGLPKSQIRVEWDRAEIITKPEAQ